MTIEELTTAIEGITPEAFANAIGSADRISTVVDDLRGLSSTVGEITASVNKITEQMDPPPPTGDEDSGASLMNYLRDLGLEVL